MKNEHWAIQGIILNEIVYHRSDFIGQYKVGLQTNKDHFGAGFLLMGVGASEYANQLFQKGKIREARSWARKSVKAWDFYAT